MKDKVILITGAASGIGKATAYEAANRGAKLTIIDIQEKIHEVANQIKDCTSNTNVISICTDLSKMENHQGIISTILENYGRLDIACNNAGVEQFPSSLIDVDEETWERIMNVNLKSVWMAMKHQIPLMVKQGCGSIVNTSSVAGIKGVPEIGVYNTSKAGLLMLSRTAALEYASKGIRINCICPGLVMTEMAIRMSEECPDYFNEKLLKVIPMGRGANPREIAKTLLFLCSGESSFITGQAIVADGGWLA